MNVINRIQNTISYNLNLGLVLLVGRLPSRTQSTPMLSICERPLPNLKDCAYHRITWHLQHHVSTILSTQKDRGCSIHVDRGKSLCKINSKPIPEHQLLRRLLLMKLLTSLHVRLISLKLRNLIPKMLLKPTIRRWLHQILLILMTRANLWKLH